MLQLIIYINMNEVTLLIDGIRFKFWSRIRIIQKIDSIFRENILKLINLYVEPLQNLLHKEYNHARN